MCTTKCIIKTCPVFWHISILNKMNIKILNELCVYSLIYNFTTMKNTHINLDSTMQTAKAHIVDPLQQPPRNLSMSTATEALILAWTAALSSIIDAVKSDHRLYFRIEQNDLYCHYTQEKWHFVKKKINK